MSLSHVIMYFFRSLIAITLSGHQRRETVAQEGDVVCTDQSGRRVAAGGTEQRPSELQVSVLAIQWQRFSTIPPTLTGALRE